MFVRTLFKCIIYLLVRDSFVVICEYRELSHQFTRKYCYLSDESETFLNVDMLLSLPSFGSADLVGFMHSYRLQ